MILISIGKVKEECFGLLQSEPFEEPSSYQNLRNRIFPIKY